jgi:hypothetical protein
MMEEERLSLGAVHKAWYRDICTELPREECLKTLRLFIVPCNRSKFNEFGEQHPGNCHSTNPLFEEREIV